MTEIKIRQFDNSIIIMLRNINPYKTMLPYFFHKPVFLFVFIFSLRPDKPRIECVYAMIQLLLLSWDIKGLTWKILKTGED